MSSSNDGLERFENDTIANSGSSSSSEIELAARWWVQHDPNPATREYVKERIVAHRRLRLEEINKKEEEETTATKTTETTVAVQHEGGGGEHHHQQQSIGGYNDDDELALLFPLPQRRIEFGTAGLRSAMQVGPLHMNDLVVIQTAQGIAKYCQNELLPSAAGAATSETGVKPCSSSAGNEVTTVIVGDAASVEHANKKARRDDGDDDDNVNISSNEETTNRLLRVVIGYDHREYTALGISSRQFAIWTALVFRQVFDHVVLLDGYMATPIVPFAVGLLSSRRGDGCGGGGSSDKLFVASSHCCTIGIQITASHNRKQDAGYKIYWHDGCQIRSPIDSGMAESIEQNLTPWIDYEEKLNELKRKIRGDSDSDDHREQEDPCLGLSDREQTGKIVDAYFRCIAESSLRTELLPAPAAAAAYSASFTNRPTFCYTAMHGVGYRFVKRAFGVFFGDAVPLHSVGVQQEPDPEFPTVAFPNPEERGALELAKMYSARYNADIILANDPDADRLAVAERKDGEWTVFTGDQIGVLLGHWLWQKQLGDTSVVPAMFASAVSSNMLAEIAKREGFYFQETLTGFKWIGSRAAALHNTPVPSSKNDDPDSPTKTYKSLFCYEEAIGFCCGDVVFDKDGITAAAVFADLCLSIYAKGMTVQQRLQTLYNEYGEFVSNNGYYIMEDCSVVQTIMDRITNHGKFDTLDTVGPYPVESVRYLGVPGYDSTTPDCQPTLPCSRSSPMLTLRFTNGCVAQFRGSGTEPKFKYYIELKGALGKSRDDVAIELEEMSSALLEALLEPKKNGLSRRS
jgi:phosphoglucomutase